MIIVNVYAIDLSEDCREVKFNPMIFNNNVEQAKKFARHLKNDCPWFSDIKVKVSHVSIINTETVSF